MSHNGVAEQTGLYISATLRRITGLIEWCRSFHKHIRIMHIAHLRCTWWRHGQGHQRNDIHQVDSGSTDIEYIGILKLKTIRTMRSPLDVCNHMMRTSCWGHEHCLCIEAPNSIPSDLQKNWLQSFARETMAGYCFIKPADGNNVILLCCICRALTFLACGMSVCDNQINPV